MRTLRIIGIVLAGLVAATAVAYGGWWYRGEQSTPSSSQHLTVIETMRDVPLLIQTDHRLAGSTCTVGAGTEVRILGDDTDKVTIFAEQISGVDTLTSCPSGSIYKMQRKGLSLVSVVPTVTPHPAATQTAIAYCGLVANATNKKPCG